MTTVLHDVQTQLNSSDTDGKNGMIRPWDSTAQITHALTAAALAAFGRATFYSGGAESGAPPFGIQPI